MGLNAYITRTQQLLHDPTGVYYSQPDLISYINTARGQIAAEAMCVRVLPPSATGQNQTVLNQEVYTFASLAPLIQATSPGVSGILGVITIAVNQGTTLKPVLSQKAAWSEFQAVYRSCNIGLQNYPVVWSQYGQGALGSVYVWPIPSGAYAMDWDCYCLPIDLTVDGDPEAIPYPWTDAIPYFAAYLAFSNAQRPADADRAMAQYTSFMNRATAFSNQIMVPDFYGSPGTVM